MKDTKMKDTKFKAIIYIRLSVADDKSKTESDSVSNQRKLINEWLKTRPDIEVVGEKVDDGWSGLIFDRPAFQEMMGEMTAGKANCCITKDAYVKLRIKQMQFILFCRGLFRGKEKARGGLPLED